MIQITFGQITIAGNDTAELDIALSYLGRLREFAPVPVQATRASTTSAVPVPLYTEEQTEQAKDAIAKGYSFESSFKAITGMERLRRTPEERARGLNPEKAALERLQAIANGTEANETSGTNEAPSAQGTAEDVELRE